MRLNKNKNLFIITTNEAGIILSISSYATKVLSGISIGDDVFSLVDASELRKLSMYNSKAIVRKSMIEDFPIVIMRSSLKSHMKTVELCFVPKRISAEGAMKNAENVLSLYTEKRGAISKVNLRKYIEDILFALGEKKANRGIDASITGNGREIEISPTCLELLVLTTISALVDVNFKDKISIAIDEHGFSVSLALKVINGLQEGELLELFPQLTSRLYLLRSICEDEGIDMNLITSGGEIIFDFDLTRLAKGRVALGVAGSVFTERLSHYINILFA